MWGVKNNRDSILKTLRKGNTIDFFWKILRMIQYIYADVAQR